MNMDTYRIKWDPDHPEKGAELLGVSPGKREVVQHYKRRSGEIVVTYLVLHLPGHSWYTGRTGNQTAYESARFEVYAVVQHIKKDLWEVDRLVEFYSRFKKKAE